MKLEVKDLACGYGKKVIIGGISFEINEGEALFLLGPNGAGKTTFFKTLLGFLKPLSGNVILNGKDISTMGCREKARNIAYVPQAHSVPFAFNVEDVVVMGRNAHMGKMSSPSSADRRVALDCMSELGVAHLREKSYSRISGGERQMVLIARALTQGAKLLVLDEPTSNLDFGNQVKILDKINQLKKLGISSIITSHSPDHAFLCGTRVVVFREGKFAETGAPRSVVTEGLLKKVYGVNVLVRAVDAPKNIKVCVPCLA